MQQPDLIHIIAMAFQNVKLEEGVGLSEADAIDDYATDEEKAQCRNKDEKENWQRISSMDLNKYHCSLSYFDAKGMRFHLPAFMIAELKGEYSFGVTFTLTHLSDYSQSQFVLLNDEQRKSVRLFLEWILTNDDYDFEKPAVINALKTYWL